ncbi:hypothetical protein BV22DRAFT_1063463 [Leucogyrophana mollusca]|uniref:Uncharacterized protein n=1 Tax=Leucogyrophana mollusca TaxID=85980 RepID=A0ACB8BLR5_9AGAM|nr:hypothetical protein BV22DRAFT_1063463 [Leucogyrophana mollusca]
MEAHPRHPLPRLSIPPNLTMQQPFDGRQPMFSPGLPTSLQQSFHPVPYHMSGLGPLQTPMQPYFQPQPPPAPGRPSYATHHGRPSIAHYPGMPPQTAVPITPLGQGFPSMMLGPPFPPPFIPRNRRNPSISIGGPPKAPLGGPGRKHSPLPPQPVVPPPATMHKGKKIIINFPQETVLGDADQPPTRPSWARVPMPVTSLDEVAVLPPEVDTAESFPPDSWRQNIPDTVDVFLPGKIAWDALKQRVIEEKLEKLGVERGSGNSIPIHAPHARAASISSPADPSLLYFKLNKLQESQNASASTSLAASPQPAFNLSSSPNAQLPPRLQNRHGHSLSLAQPPSHPPFYNPTASFNPFGPSAVLGSDQIEMNGLPDFMHTQVEGIHAPQGRVPLAVSSLAPPIISRGNSRPDFNLGFGLDIPEEEEPAEDGPLEMHENPVDEIEGLPRASSQGATSTVVDGSSTAAQSRLHSRHVSRLSNALSLRSVGGIVDGALPENVDVDVVPVRSPVGNPGIDDLDQEAVGEWTGSEDQRLGGESDDEESIGEWSNPSDEERARQERVHRRLLRHRKREIETPRRLPNFPAPPGAAFVMPLPNEYDVGSHSEEGLRTGPRTPYLGEFPVRPSSASTNGRGGRPLPPLPHSRGASGQLSAHDPALAHSRAASEQFKYPEEQPTHAKKPSTSGSLNPHAKPFVFGSSRQSGSWSFDAMPPPQAPVFGHARLPSFGKPLNAAAQEFKPGGFTFRPPAGVPQLTFPAPEPSRPLPLPPVKPSPVRAQQGREKRQRRGSHSTISDEDNDSGKENMASFRFPALDDSPRSLRRSAPTTPGRSRDLDGGGPLQSLTFAGFPSAMPFAPESDNFTFENFARDGEGNVVEESENVENMYGTTGSFPTIVPTKTRRAPIPLDFKQATSSNTVPAGLFKALVGDEKTRRTVRSRLSSREIFEHSQRPSLDDLSVPPISQNRSRARLVTDPGYKHGSFDSADVFTPAIKRRSSLPALQSAHNSSLSNVSIPALNLTKRLEAQALEEKIEALLDDKFQMLRRELSHHRESGNGHAINPSTEDMITEVVGLFRAQLQESAARGLEDSQMDARGELDLELIKDVVQQGHAESLHLLRNELHDVIRRLESQPRQIGAPATDLIPVLEQLNHRSLQVILNNVGQLSAKIDHHQGHQPRPFAGGYDREALTTDLMTALTPLLAGLRPDPVDYDYLTHQLSQAVKPNIEQLIDLASDKRETAGLIVDSILPLLPNSSSSSLDTTAIIGQLTAEVRRVIAPVDAHEIKEQVADLVVERLDSRLAVRDKAFNVDMVSTKVIDGVSGMMDSMKDLGPRLDKLAEEQRTITSGNNVLVNKHDGLAELLSGLPAQLSEVAQTLQTVKDTPPPQSSADDIKQMMGAVQRIESLAGTMASGQSSTSLQTDELLSLHKALHKDVLDRLNTLPETLNAATSALQTAHAEFAVSRDASKRDLDEIKKLKASNTELQVQLAKARGAHGQVRVEKDNLGERLREAEAERDRLRASLEESQATIKSQASEAATVEARNSELEDALAQSLARLKASDVAAQANQERISDLEKQTRDGAAAQQNLKAKVDELQLQVKFAAHEKDLALQSLGVLQKEHEHLAAQQSHWDDLRRASEQIEMLTNLMSQADNEELKELRRARDQSKALESEHAALQKRFREQEHKVANSERAANAARQNLAQAQQRASEWERRAKEYEGDLEMTRTKLEQAEQSQVQLDADYSLARLQLEEKDAEDRLVKDRENKLRDQVVSLEAQVARLETELAKAKSTPAVSKGVKYGQPLSTKNQSPPRPDSRASTVFGGDRARTPVGRMNGSQPARSDTPPQSSVWDSMHAPPKQYPNLGPAQYTRPLVRRPISQYRPAVASPTPSTVSLTPTQDEEGWWS